MRRPLLVIAVTVLLLASMGAAVASDDVYQGEPTEPYSDSETHNSPFAPGETKTVTYDVDYSPTDSYVEVNAQDMGINVEWYVIDDQGNRNLADSASRTSGGTFEADLSGYTEEEVEIEITAESLGDDASAELVESGIYYHNTAPKVSDIEPENGTLIDDSSIFLGGQINKTEFDYPGYDGAVDIEFRDADDDSIIGTDTQDENGTAFTIWDDAHAGENNWYIVAEDEHGAVTETDVYTFYTPDELIIRDETTTEIIDEEQAEVEVRFYRADTDEVMTRIAENGTVSLSGLPINERMIVDARADGYHSRQIILESLSEQQTIYLLSEDENTVLTEFELEDRTSLFSSGESRLLVQKPIQLDSEESAQYRTMAGDEFGADGRMSTYLEAGDRYRLVVENNDGDSRSLGSYTAERDEVVPLEIGTIQLIQPEDGGYVFSARMADEEEHGENMVAITYVDDAGLTDTLEYTIHSRGNDEDVAHGPVTVNDPETYSEIVEIPENGTYEVTWQADRDGEEIGNTLPIGSVGPLHLPISSTLLQVLGLSGIVLMAGLFGGTMSRTGAVVIVVVAWGMQILGIVSIPYPLLVSAGIVSIMFKVGVGGRR